MQRFYYTQLQNEKIIIIKHDNNIYHQLTKVLRCKSGDKIILFDGSNYTDLVYEIESMDKKSISIKLIEKIEKKCNTKIKLNLYQALPNKHEKIELILQKGVEVGYNSFYFFKSERSQNLKISENKIERFKKIIIEAVEQSGKNITPELHFSNKIDFKNIKGDNIYFHTDKTNAKKLKDLNIKKGKANIFIGPEGGFSDNEISIFNKTGFQKVNLGNSILRTETAGIVVGFYLLENA